MSGLTFTRKVSSLAGSSMDCKLVILEQTSLVDEEFWYVVIAVLSVLIILALLGFCFILGRRREKSNAELIKTANER